MPVDPSNFLGHFWGQFIMPGCLICRLYVLEPQSMMMILTTGDFAVSSTRCTTSLAGKGKCTINVTFTPTEKGTRTGQLKVRDSAANSPQTSKLTGVGK
jgi:Abnormal spindle-like microcephaly-assoc'd, ASPM-SPD-2-Hydin